MKKRIAAVAALCVMLIMLCVGAGVAGKKDVPMSQTPETPATVSEADATVSENEITPAVSENTPAPAVSENDFTVSGNEPTVSENAIMVSGNDPAPEPEEPVSEYADFAIADADRYVNVRSGPSTEDEIVGKIYDGAVAHIVCTAGEENDWFQITSGNVEGYIKAEFFIYGEDAVAVIEEYVTRYVVVQADRLNVRRGPSTEESRIGYLDHEEKAKMLEDCGEWIRVEYADGKEGYVAAEYVTVTEEFAYAKTLEEERAEIAAREEQEKRQQEAEEKVPEVIINAEPPATTYTSNEELRKAIVDYALQYVGSKYVSGGSSLATGTDCSGFTCFVLAEFGYTISRIPQGQYENAGRSIDMSQIQPGDIICFSSNGGASCTHVAFYIGDGQIVHAANPRKGVIISTTDFEPIIGIKNVLD